LEYTFDQVAAAHPTEITYQAIADPIDEANLDYYQTIIIGPPTPAWTSAQITALSDWVSGEPDRRVVICHDSASYYTNTNAIVSGIGMNCTLQDVHTPSAASEATVNHSDYLTSDVDTLWQSYASRIYVPYPQPPDTAPVFVLAQDEDSLGNLITIAVEQDIQTPVGGYIGGSRILIGDIRYMLDLLWIEDTDRDPDGDKNKLFFYNLCTRFRTL
jgi:hypothetical protein